MNPLRILTVAGWVHPDAEGGSFRFIYELNRALVQRGHRATILTGRIRDDLPPEEDLDGMRVVRYPVRPAGGFRFYYSAITSIRRMLPRLADECDVIHLHHTVSAFAAARCVGLDAPVVHTFHIAYFMEYLDRVSGEHSSTTGGQKLAAALLKRMESYTLKRCRRVVVLSDAVSRQIREHFPDIADRTVKIPGGVDLAFFSASLSKVEARERMGLPVDRPLLLTVRRLEPRMGIENLIDAMPAIRSAFPRSLLLIGGRGSLGETLRRQAKLAGLTEAVRFLGYIEEEDLPAYYGAADVFVLPTRALEGFGMVTLEAFACGTPAVVTPAGASPELAEPVDPQLVAAGTDPGDIADAVVAFLNRPDTDALAQRCREHAEQFSWDTIAQQYEQVYEEVISSGTEAD